MLQNPPSKGGRGAMRLDTAVDCNSCVRSTNNRPHAAVLPCHPLIVPYAHTCPSPGLPGTWHYTSMNMQHCFASHCLPCFSAPQCLHFLDLLVGPRCFPCIYISPPPRLIPAPQCVHSLNLLVGPRCSL
jgi:hypothetical protein